MNWSKRSEIKKQGASESGFITLDFIFALFMALGFATVFFAISVTLALVEAAQYVTFATSRAYAGAHETENAQRELAMAKFNEIMSKSAFKRFLGQEWMRLGEPNIGDFSSEYPVDNPDDNTFVGVQIPMDARLLHMRLPLLGSTAEDSGVGKATLNSYLNREVSTTECREQFNRLRYEHIKRLDGAYSGTPGSEAKLITDNGC